MREQIVTNANTIRNVVDRKNLVIIFGVEERHMKERDTKMEKNPKNVINISNEGTRELVSDKDIIDE